MVEYVLLGVVEFMLFVVPLLIEFVVVGEFVLFIVPLRIEFVLSVVTGDVYVGFVVELVVEYVLVVVWAFAMPIPIRLKARSENCRFIALCFIVEL
ncbi:hypothetical protein GCM10027085_41870 [Spirosoma aerophilum]